MNITQENYYEITDYMSASLFKQFINCEHTGFAMYKGEYKPQRNTAMLIGAYIDAWVEGTLDKFILDNPKMFKKDGTLRADFVNANDIIERIKNDSVFMEFLNGDKQKIVTGTIEDIPFKGKLDVYNGERIVDLKIMRSCERIIGKSLVDHWGYDIQMTIYQELIYQETGKRVPCYLAIATKEKPANLELVEIEQHKLDNALEYVKRMLPRMHEIMTGSGQPLRCNSCEYCRQTKVVTSPIPSDYLGLSELDIKNINGEEI